jgi:hypothetical protein
MEGGDPMTIEAIKAELEDDSFISTVLRPWAHG